MARSVALFVAASVMGIFALGAARQGAEEPGRGYNLLSLALMILSLVLAAVG